MTGDSNGNGNGNWHFPFWPTLAFCCLLPLLSGLGVWQLQRGGEKRAAHDAFLHAAATPAVDAGDLSISGFNALPRYRHVRLVGHYLADRQFILDNMPRAGRPGHHVLTPFAPADSDYLVIVDRGWRPGRATEYSRESAQASARKIAVDGELREVSGLLAPFPQPALDLDGDTSAPGWPKPVQFPDADTLARLLDRKVAEPRLLLDGDATDGFRREWEPPGIPSARHYAYAFQWFALAVTLVAIFVFMARRRRARDDRQ